MNYVEDILLFLDCFTGLTWTDRFGAQRIIWDNEFFFQALHDFEKEMGKKCAGLLSHARYRYGLEYRYGISEVDIDEPPIVVRDCDINEKRLTLFASGHIYLTHCEYYNLNPEPEKFLFKTSEEFPEDVRNSIIKWHKIIKENMPEAITSWCASLSLCLGTELLGYVYLTPDEERFVYSIPVKTGDDKRFMMKIFNKMNILIGQKPTDTWRNQPEKEFRHNIAKPFLRNRYFKYRESGLCLNESLEKAIEDIKKKFPQWKDLWDFMAKNSIMRNYIRKQT